MPAILIYMTRQNLKKHVPAILMYMTRHNLKKEARTSNLDVHDETELKERSMYQQS